MEVTCRARADLVFTTISKKEMQNLALVIFEVRPFRWSPVFSHGDWSPCGLRRIVSAAVTRPSN